MLKYRVYLENYWEAQFDEFNSVDYTKHFSNDKPCNIYLVGIRPRVMIIPESFVVVNKKVINLTFVIQYDLREIEEKTIEILLPRELVGKANLKSNKPHSRFQIFDEAGKIFEELEITRDNSVEAKAFYVLRNNLKDPNELREINDLEVVYIGQSLKMDKTISPTKRVINHKKIQQVLEKCNRKHIYEEVYILLCSFVQKVSILLDSHEEDLKNGQNTFEYLQKDSQQFKEKTPQFRTNVAEAALIDYFDTREFNQDFIGTFGRKTHSYFSKLTLRSISEVSLEVDLTKLCYLFSKDQEGKNYHSISYDPHNNFKKNIHDFRYPK